MVMAAGAKKIGYKEYSTGNMAINSRRRDGRPATTQDGFCYQGIRFKCEVVDAQRRNSER